MSNTKGSGGKGCVKGIQVLIHLSTLQPQQNTIVLLVPEIIMSVVSLAIQTHFQNAHLRSSAGQTRKF